MQSVRAGESAAESPNLRSNFFQCSFSLSLSLSPVNGNSDNLQQRLIQNPKDDSEQFIKSSQLVNQFNQNAKYIDQYPEVSIWRTLFVANEYCELSAYRRVSASFHLFILLIVLQVRALSKVVMLCSKSAASF